MIIDDDEVFWLNWQAKLKKDTDVVWSDTPEKAIDILKADDKFEFIIVDRFFDNIGIDLFDEDDLAQLREYYSGPVILSSMARIRKKYLDLFDLVIPKKCYSFKEIMNRLSSTV